MLEAKAKSLPLRPASSLDDVFALNNKHAEAHYAKTLIATIEMKAQQYVNGS